MQQNYEQVLSAKPSTRSAAHIPGLRGVSKPAVPVFPLQKKGIIQGVFMVAYSNGVPTYLKSPMIKKPDDPPFKPDNYVEEDLDMKFETAENKSEYWHSLRLLPLYLIKPSQAEFASYMEEKRKQLGIPEIWKMETAEQATQEGPGLEMGQLPMKGMGMGKSQLGQEGPQAKKAPRRVTHVSAQDTTELVDPRVTALALSLFDPSVRGDADVMSMVNGALGTMFVKWAAGTNVLDESDLEANITKAVDTKLVQFQQKYRGLQLIDMIVVSAYSWRADKFMREEMKRKGWADFGRWQAFADQLIVSLRKLRRFTGEELYRCGRQGHEGAELEKEPFSAHSFLSTTYDKKALAGLEEDPKYKHGDTLKMRGKMEGYHMEEFSHFQGEREVILLPGHTLNKGGDRSGRNLPIAVTSPANFQPLRGDEPDAIAELEQQRRQELANMPPPPKSMKVVEEKK